MIAFEIRMLQIESDYASELAACTNEFEQLEAISRRQWAIATLVIEAKKGTL